MKLSKIFLLLVAAGMAVISSDAQERGRESNTRTRGYLGASVESSSKPKGLRIQQVFANTAAARAKLKKGDIILKMNGSAVTSNSALIGRLSKTKPGQKATLLVSSGGKTKTVQVQLGRPYSTRSSAQSGSSRSRSSSRPSTPQRVGDIVDVAASNKSFKTLVTAVKAAGLVDTLKAKGPYTVFAPTDEAFSKLPKDTLQSLLKPENKKKLASILTYHVVPGKVLAKDVKSGKVKTANGSSFEVRVSRAGVTVDKAKVVATDVMANNGVIHVIDTVILPKSNPTSRSSQSRDSSRSRTPQRSSGTDWRKAIEERMKKAREDRERAERNSRERDDRGEDMRKAWEERMKQWQRERGNSDNPRSPQRGPQRWNWRGPRGR